MPTSVVIATFLTTFARMAVPTVVRASGEPLGMSTLGVTDRLRFGVKLTAAAAKVGAAGTLPVADAGICPNDRLNGAPPVVMNVSLRAGDASAGPASAASRKTAGSRWSPRLDATEIRPNRSPASAA